MDDVPNGEDDNEPSAEEEDSKKRKVRLDFYLSVMIVSLTLTSASLASGVESINQACLQAREAGVKS